MSDINWESAPEGATHTLGSGCFYKIDKIGGNDYCYFKDKWEPCALTQNYINDLTPIPALDKKESSDIGVTCFDLMFHGCQEINAPQAIEILNAIKAGKIHNVTWSK